MIPSFGPSGTLPPFIGNSPDRLDVMKALERQALLADRRTVRDLLDRLPGTDPLGRMSLEARLAEIDASLAALEESQEDEKRATVRIVESDREVSLDVPAVHRGRQRIDAIQITDSVSEEIVGELLGLLPGSHRFELRLPTGEIIKGSVSAEVGLLYLSLIETPDESPVGRLWRTKMRIREVQERNKLPRKLFTLVGLVERI